MAERIEVKRTSLRASSDALKFKPAKPLLGTPLEISRDKLKGLNMVDETIVVRGSLRDKGDCK